MEREYDVTIRVKMDSETVEEGKKKAIALLGTGFNVLEVHHAPDRMTERQRRALHLYFALLAKELNDAGFDMRKTIREGIDVPWNKDMVKEFLWRPTQVAMLNKKSTRGLKKDEIDKVWEVVNRAIGERTGVHVPFPSIDSMFPDDR